VGPGSLGARLFAAILVASLIATALVVRARSPDLMLEVPKRTDRFHPDGDGRRDVARITYFVRESEPAATVQVVGAHLRVARTFVSAKPLEANRRYNITWDGRRDSGRPAPPGRYRLRVLLPSLDRDMVFPRRIELRR
jgi:hypothetical protein